jgi:drug/metabolite transporter (DMT)-like permease
MTRLKKSTATILATLAVVLLAAGYLLFGAWRGWEYILGFFPIITIVVVIVGVVLWILEMSKEKKKEEQ